jgi:hypothetical protein
MVDLSIDLTPTSATYKDLLVTEGDLTLTSDANPNGTNPVLQDIIQRIQFFLGEWFLDSTQGVGWFQQILVKNPDQPTVDAIFQNVILGTPGVNQLSSYSFTPNFTTRTLNVSFIAVTTSGTVNYNGVVAPVTGVANS